MSRISSSMALGADSDGGLPRDEANRLYREVERLHAAGGYVEAGARAGRLVGLLEPRLAEGDPAPIPVLVGVARLLSIQGDGAAAEPLLRRVLDVVGEVAGVHHTDYAAVLTNLAVVLQGRGNLAGAEPLLRRALAIRRYVLGESHPDFAAALNNLALVLQKRGSLSGAEPLLRQALAIRRDVLGEQHPDYATSLLGLAFYHKERGDLGWAKLLTREALAIRKSALGGRHLDYARNLANLAEVFWAQADLERAEPLLREALAVQKERLGVRHPEYATGLSLLAGLLRKREDLAAAEPLLQRALEIRRNSLGEHHPDSLNSLSNLALLLQRRGDLAGALLLLRKVLNIRKELLGESSPDYIRSAKDLNFQNLNNQDFDTFEFALQRDFLAWADPSSEPEPGPDDFGVIAAEGVQPGWAGGQGRPVSEAADLADRAEDRPMYENGGDHAVAQSEPAEPADRAGDRALGEGSQDLAREREALEGVFVDLGERLLHAARRLHAPGSLPSAQLLEELAARRREFDALRDRAIRLAGSLDVACPPPEELESLGGLAALMTATAEAEAHRERAEGTRRDALAVVDRIASLAYLGADDFAPLQQCQAAATALREALVGAAVADLPPETADLAGGSHPLAGLLTLVEGRDELDDESWASLHESVAAAYGKSLAAAAARSRIVQAAPALVGE